MSLVRHLVTHGDEVALKTYRYLRSNGVKATAKHAADILFRPAPPPSSNDPGSIPTAAELQKKRFAALAPLPVYSTPRKAPRINLITDSINAGSLYGGVGTALMFMMLLAERKGCDLRVITRHAPANETNFKHIAELVGLQDLGNIEFKLCPDASREVDLDIGEQELFITTSWWTTWPTVKALGSSRVVYILQEDERMFYPQGDDWLRCSEMLSHPDLFFLVNSRRLFDWLGSGDLPNIARNGTWFEPAFPADLFYYQPRPQQAKSRLLFYARPNNVRNLFYRGVEALDQALVSGVIDPDRWELHLVGKDIPAFTFPSPIAVHRYENLSWRDYAELVRSMDLGLSLMYTPHPSYPPLDLAASGAVVVTNRFGSKQDLDEYSRNILCVDPTVDGLVRGLAHGVALAEDHETRQANFRQSGIRRDWRESFKRPLDLVLSRFLP